ncbi:endonuclease G inhibitor [Glossina fuscipes fuscipes]
MSVPTLEDFLNFEAKISLDKPVEDYVRLMDDRMKTDALITDEGLKNCFEKISSAARETVWKLLFEGPCTIEKQVLASDLLREHKADAGFFNPWPYNEWIVKVRDELLKRQMILVWRDEIVRKELGPCCSRDSDLFEDDNEEAAKFYEFAGCQARWKEVDEMSTIPDDAPSLSPILSETALSPAETGASVIETNPANVDFLADQFKTLSCESPLEDYKHNMFVQTNINANDTEGFKKILAEAREKIWHFLFDQSSLPPENFEKAAKLLQMVKSDSCTFSPYDYNDWIVKVRDELFKRGYLKFWERVIVANKLGLCWYKDSEYFDDRDDKAPLQFYEFGEH